MIFVLPGGGGGGGRVRERVEWRLGGVAGGVPYCWRRYREATLFKRS